ncbi:glutathione S-transferase [Caulobacter sp.]|uniref:glutathione S-transferase family protein n=1 Tax=Caulobacter sp. TaxID=78 RepID=UPI002B4A4100|nr:glutathione S-transferase [Caulobacter sp.]HJV40338.1 glutathione S-transferase [Caulobacter sp.]
MKLYGEAMPAPNPRRVRIFLAEKGLEVPEIRIGMREGGHKSPEHLARNSLGQVPVLELDDGTAISETIAICRYFEVLHPTPPMFGVTALEQAQVEMWTRRIEFRLMVPIGLFWRHAHPLTARLLKQNVAFGESNREVVEKAQAWLNRELADGRPYLTGETFTIADIAGQTALDFADFTGLATPGDAEHVLAWRARMAARPSAGA